MSHTSPTAPSARPAPAARPAVVADVPVGALIVLAGLLTALVIILAAIDRAQQLLGLAVLAAILSATVRPAIERLARPIGRTTATVAIHLLVLIGVTALTGLALAELRSQADALDRHLDRELLELQLQEGHNLLSRIGLSQRLDESLASFGTTAVVGDDGTTMMLTRFSQLAIVVVLSGFLAHHGDRIVGIAIRTTPDRERRRVLWEVWRDSVATSATFLRRSLAVAAISGLGALASSVAFGLPGPLLLAMWAAAASLVPLFGIAVGWTPIVLVALFSSSSATFGAVATVSAASVVLLIWCRSRILDLDVGPTRLISAVGLAAGLSAAGPAGALAGLFLSVAIARAVAHDWTRFGLSAVLPFVDETPMDPQSAGEASPAQAPIEHGGTHRDEEDAVGTGWGRRVTLTLSPRSAIRVMAVVLVAFVLQRWITRVGLPLVWAIVGFVVAVGVDRPVTWLERRTRSPRWFVAAVLSTLLVAVVVLLGLTAGPELRSVIEVEDEVPELVASLESLPLVGERLADLELERRFEEFRGSAPRWLSRSPLAGQAIDLIGGGLVGIFWIVTIGGAALLDGPQLVASASCRIPARLHRQSVRLGRVTRDAIAGYAAGSAVVALLNGAIVTTLGLVFGVPLAVVLGVWAMAWNFIPQFGAVIGWAPFLALAIATGPVTGVLLLVLFVLYQAVENNLIQPAIVGHAVDISALAALGAALFGAAVGGLVGAVLAVPAVGVVRALLVEVRRADFPKVDLSATGYSNTCSPPVRQPARASSTLQVPDGAEPIETWVP